MVTFIFAFITVAAAEDMLLLIKLFVVVVVVVEDVVENIDDVKDEGEIVVGDVEVVKSSSQDTVVTGRPVGKSSDQLSIIIY